MIRKTVTAAALALTLAGAGLAFAQSNHPSSNAQGARFTAEDIAAMTDARIAALKAGLKLTPEQEKNWPAVETALRDIAKQRADRVNARREQRAERREARRAGDGAAQAAPNTIARLRQGADAMTARAEGLKKLADASEPLYNSLDDGQKRRFAMLLRMSGRTAAWHRHHWQHRADNGR